MRLFGNSLWLLSAFNNLQYGYKATDNKDLLAYFWLRSERCLLIWKNRLHINFPSISLSGVGFGIMTKIYVPFTFSQCPRYYNEPPALTFHARFKKCNLNFLFERNLVGGWAMSCFFNYFASGTFYVPINWRVICLSNSFDVQLVKRNNEKELCLFRLWFN